LRSPQRATLNCQGWSQTTAFGDFHETAFIDAGREPVDRERHSIRESLPHGHEIDEALAANPKLSEAEMADVKKLRAEGEASHNAGDHAKSLEALGKAMKILKVQ
jgi:hypothetical protein